MNPEELLKATKSEIDKFIRSFSPSDIFEKYKLLNKDALEDIGTILGAILMDEIIREGREVVMSDIHIDDLLFKHAECTIFIKTENNNPNDFEKKIKIVYDDKLNLIEERIDPCSYNQLLLIEIKLSRDFLGGIRGYNSEKLKLEFSYWIWKNSKLELDKWLNS